MYVICMYVCVLFAYTLHNAITQQNNTSALSQVPAADWDTHFIDVCYIDCG